MKLISFLTFSCSTIFTFSCSSIIAAKSIYAQAEDNTGYEITQNPPTLELIHQFSGDGLDEISGIVKSRRYPDTYWIHNDSGDTARIFAIRGDGTPILPTYSRFSYYGEKPVEGLKPWQGFPVLNADHIDWEDIAADENYLYIGDIGNNRNNREDLKIYAVSEIDATASTRSAVIFPLSIRYPDQETFPPKDWHFDAESLFVDDSKLYVITKHRKLAGLRGWEPGAKLYRLDTRYTDRENTLVLVDVFPDIVAPTGAELSPSGQTLAVLTYHEVWLFSKPTEGDKWLSAPSRSIPLNPEIIEQCEAITWVDEHTLLIANENRALFRLKL